MWITLKTALNFWLLYHFIFCISLWRFVGWGFISPCFLHQKQQRQVLQSILVVCFFQCQNQQLCS